MAASTHPDVEIAEPSNAATRPKYPLGVPSKFDPDGNVQPFPGNTIISHLSPSSELYASLLALHSKLERSPLSSLFTLLPPSSWHMTIFEGVCDQVRTQPGFWPSDLPVDTPLEECTAHLGRKLGTFDLQCAPPYRVSATGFDPLEIGIGVTLQLRDAGEEARLRALRDRLADLLLICHPQHKVYNLHLSMAYLLRHLTEGQEAELRQLLEGHLAGATTSVVNFELGAPEYCSFEDMFAFKRLFYLRDQESG